MAAEYDPAITCGKCKFWFRKMKRSEADPGDCRRLPPTVQPITMAGQGSGGRWTRTEWPSTTEDMWCGEFVDDRLPL